MSKSGEIYVPKFNSEVTVHYLVPSISLQEGKQNKF